MTKVYQLGESSIIQYKEINAIIRGLDALELLHGEEIAKYIYKETSDLIREKYGFNYVVALAAHKNKVDVKVIIFEQESGNGISYNRKFDKELGKHYIEVE